MTASALRNFKEIVRDKINLIFGIGFPLVLLYLLSLIQANIPVELFTAQKLVPGIAVFGLSFMALFSGMLIAKDRSTSLMTRLLTSPMRASDFIFSYTLPFIPISLIQIIICFVAAIPLGLSVNLKLLIAICVMLPAAVLYIAIGLLCGSVLNDKQVSGLCGALLTNLSAWLSGTWFDPALVSGVFKKIADLLPFMHAVNAGRAALSGSYSDILPELIWVVGYAIVILIFAIIAFKRKMTNT